MFYLAKLQKVGPRIAARRYSGSVLLPVSFPGAGGGDEVAAADNGSLLSRSQHSYIYFSFLIGRTRDINQLWAMSFGKRSRNRRNRDRAKGLKIKDGDAAALY